MIKILIAILLLAIVISLFSGLFFLVKDDKKSRRTVNALTVRVTLAALLVAVIIYGALTGQIGFHPSPINGF